MKHIRTVSRAQSPALGATTPLEQLIILFLSVVFRGWDNVSPVVQNLQKFYGKT
ncbi:MAG: hypothetical protein HZB26_04010 [Candidatus Hydrogenedentes bacterium]|nr:hypothetical protein [Candidatus Hydrogenedentota bacterium]